MELVSNGGGRRVEAGAVWVAVTHHLPPPGVQIEVDLGTRSGQAEIREEAGEMVWVFDPAMRLPRSPVFGAGRPPSVRVKRWRLLAPRRVADPVTV